MATTETRRATSPAARTAPAWMTHPASAEVSTEWLVASARAAPSWCGGASPTKARARREAPAQATTP